MPSPFLSICPHCEAKLKLKDPALIGKVARCPGCQEKFTVERAAAPSRPKVAAKASGQSASPKRRPKPKPKPPEDDELDPWLTDDLSSFDDDTGETSVPTGSTSVPPPVRGVSKKRKPSADSPSRKKRKKASVGAEHVSWIGWVVGGCIAGLIGASAWGAIAAFTFSEWGILAWIIGGFVGFGVRVGAREEDVGIAPGLTALGIALASVVLGKFLAVHFLLASIEKMVEGAANAADEEIGVVEMTEDETVDLIISEFADEIEYEWEEQGREWNEPDYENLPDDAPWEAYYDPVIWAEAKGKWEALPPDEQKNLIVQYQTGEFDLGAEFDNLEGELFAASFGLLDILFFFLAAITSFKVGSGLDFGDE